MNRCELGIINFNLIDSFELLPFCSYSGCAKKRYRYLIEFFLLFWRNSDLLISVRILISWIGLGPPQTDSFTPIPETISLSLRNSMVFNLRNGLPSIVKILSSKSSSYIELDILYTYEVRVNGFIQWKTNPLRVSITLLEIKLSLLLISFCQFVWRKKFYDHYKWVFDIPAWMKFNSFQWSV